MRRRKVTYPPAKTATKGGGATAAARTPANIERAVVINVNAMTGRSDIRPGDRVRIGGGTYAGDAGIVESVAGGVIPAVLVRTESGTLRRVRTVDLVPEPAFRPTPADDRSDQPA